MIEARKKVHTGKTNFCPSNIYEVLYLYVDL